ncbi:hypothetical protein TNCV_604721 [Trichonephila clavipes]|nr:hypothetical protein TNCV_604721 [Trichonephila clavipes]
MRKYIVGDGSKDVQLSYEDDLRPKVILRMHELNLDQAPQDINKEEFQLERVRLQAFEAAVEPGCKKELIRSGSLALKRNEIYVTPKRFYVFFLRLTERSIGISKERMHHILSQYFGYEKVVSKMGAAFANFGSKLQDHIGTMFGAIQLQPN